MNTPRPPARVSAHARSLLAAMALAAAATSAHAADGTWTRLTSGGLWGDGANWSGGNVADGDGSSANFNTLDITTDVTLSLDSARTIGNLNFADTTLSHGWIINNGGNAANTLTLAGSSPTITVSALTSGKSALISAVVAGSTDWTKTGPGLLVLSGANSFTGVVNVNQGILEARVNVNSLGTTDGHTVVQSTGHPNTGGQLVFSANGGAMTTNENIVVQGAGEGNGSGGTFAALSGRQGPVTHGGDITLDGSGNYRIEQRSMSVHTGKFTLNGDIARTGENTGALNFHVEGRNDASQNSTGQIVVNGNIDNNGGVLIVRGLNLGALVLNTAGHDIGHTTINGAHGSATQLTTLQLGVSDALATDKNLTITKGAFDLAGHDQTVNALSGVAANSTITNSAAATTSTLTVGNGDGTGASYDGVIQDGAGAIALVKTGSGTQTLGGANTYTGLTAVAAGTLALGVNGDIAFSAGLRLGTAASPGVFDVSAKNDFTFGAGQNVDGHGTILIGAGKTVTLLGTFAPGNSPGRVEVVGSLTLGDNAATTLEIASRNGGAPVAGVDFDQVSVSETVTFDGALAIDTTGLSGLGGGDSFQLFTAAAFAGQFDSVSVSGSYIASLSYDSGSDSWFGTDTLSGLDFVFSEATGALSIVGAAIPEPSAFGLVAGLGALALASGRRRRARTQR